MLRLSAGRFVTVLHVGGLKTLLKVIIAVEALAVVVVKENPEGRAQEIF